MLVSLKTTWSTMLIFPFGLIRLFAKCAVQCDYQREQLSPRKNVTTNHDWTPAGRTVPVLCRMGPAAAAAQDY